MTFYERYTELCVKHKIEPCSQKAADMFHTTRATISTWGKTKAIPRGETVKLIADALDVSTDYLLGRTNDPTDYTRTSSMLPAADQSDIAQKIAADDKKKDIDDAYSTIVDLYSQLDDIDRVRAESYIEGILTGDKYKKKRAGLA